MNHISIVEQLKEVVKAQNASLRSKEAEIQKLRAENARLVARVRELESEKDDLKARWDTYQQRFRKVSKEEQVNGDITSSALNDTGSVANSSTGELYTTALTSPSPDKNTSTGDLKNCVTVTLASTPNSSSKAFLSVRHLESGKKSLSRSDSRKAKRKSFYELSPDICDKHVQVLGKCYGGKEKADKAAIIIQHYYRNWAMRRAYCRLRTQSEVKRTSVRGRGRGGSLTRQGRSRQGSEDSNSSIPSTLNFSIDGTDAVSPTGKKLTNLTIKPNTAASALKVSPNEEFKPIQTDLNIDENFQPLGSELSVRRMSEDISSIEISKNLLNDSIGQKMIINEVFQQILSPRKDSISLQSTRKDSVMSLKSVNETKEPEVSLKADENQVEQQNGDQENTHEEKLEEKNGEVDCALEEPDERPVENNTIDSTENLQTTEEYDKFEGSDLFDSVDGHSYSWPTLDQLHGDDTSSVGGESLSPSSSIIQTFYEDKEKDMRIGINHFNRKPKKGICYLIDSGVLDDDPESICKFLREEPGINKQKIGEYLGDLRNPLSMHVLQTFVRLTSTKDMMVDEALRYFQTSFRMPGEAQKIERVVEEFSNAYVETNPGMVSNNPDTILILSFAIIMLNTDLHSPNVKRKMSKEQFIQNLRGTDNGEDLPSDVLTGVYDRIQKKAFKTGPDNLDAVMKYEKQILGKVPWTKLALPHRQLRQVTSMYEILHGGKKKEKAHSRIVFLFNDMIVVTKERGQAGQKGIHFYSYKSSYPLCDIKFSLFNNNYYKYGIRLLNKSNNQVLISLHAKKEDIRKAFYTELKDCIEETVVMESDRISSEKARQLSALGYNKRELQDTLSLTLPRPHHDKSAPDSLSLVNEPAILPENELASNKMLSSSLQDLSLAADGYYETDGLHKSSSVSSFDRIGSVSSEDVWSHYQDSSSSTSDIPNSNNGLLPAPKRFGLFSSKRAKNPAHRQLAKSTGSLEDIKTLQRAAGSPRQRKSEFFIKSPIAT